MHGHFNRANPAAAAAAGESEGKPSQETRRSGRFKNGRPEEGRQAEVAREQLQVASHKLAPKQQATQANTRDAAAYLYLESHLAEPNAN